MPTYEFECTRCAERMEVFLNLSDPQPKRCRTCRGKLEKVFHAVGIMFKGSGFYVNDSKSASNGTAAPAAKSGGAPAHNKADSNGTSQKGGKSAGAESGSGDAQ